MHVLLVKLSSMGDLIHALPALSDAQSAIPNIRFDWVVDESFADVASWHPAVNQIITTAHRRWRKQKWQTLQKGELLALFKKLRASRYDLVIDGQNNLKSAIITSLTRGTRCGLDRQSVREFGAHWTYHKKFFVPKQEHAINRLRMLFAQALNYPIPNTEPNFGIDVNRFAKPALELPKQYLIFIHNASWQSKLWPENYWIDLLKMATQNGFSVLLPAGNVEEQLRAQRLAAIHPNIKALPSMKLSQVAYIIAHAKAAVCNDTGLSHLAAAVNVPSVNLYGPTDSGLIGALGKAQIYLQADFPCAPCYKHHCSYRGPAQERPACFTKLPPTLVWQKLQTVM